jgi:hypothetical protein
MARDILAVDRMSEADLWKHLIRCLGELARAAPGELTFAERKALARRSDECARELFARGQQFAFGLRES